MGEDGFVCQYGKSKRLFRVAVKAQFFVRHYPAHRQQLPYVLHERRVQRAASADDEPRRRLRCIVPHRRGYALRGKARRRREHVQKPNPLSPGVCAERRCVLSAVALAPRRFGRALCKVRIVQHMPQELFADLPLRCKRPACVVGRRAIC